MGLFGLPRIAINFAPGTVSRSNSSRFTGSRDPIEHNASYLPPKSIAASARRIFFTTCVAGSFAGADFCLIFAPLESYDEPKILPSSTHQIYLIGADGGQSGRCDPRPVVLRCIIVSHLRERFFVVLPILRAGYCGPIVSLFVSHD